MSKNSHFSSYIKKFRSEKANKLKREHRLAYLVLDTIALNAKRKINDENTILELGEAIITAEECGLTKNEFPVALTYLESEGFIQVIHRGRKDKNSKLLARAKISQRPESKPESKLENTRIKTRINGTVAKLLDTECYDINIEDDQNQNQNQNSKTPESKPEQTRKSNKKDKESHHPYPSSSPSQEPDVAQPLTDDFSSSKKIYEKRKHNIHYQDISLKNFTEVYPGVRLSPEDLAACISIKGSLEAVKIHVEHVMRSPGRKCQIRNWPQTLATWPVKNYIKPKIQENSEMGKRLERDYGQAEGWRCEEHTDRNKDMKGILFYSTASGGCAEPFFISYVDQEFKEKVSKLIRDKKMQKGRLTYA